jgi:LCP family protein required for cell wall assembly
MAKNDDTTPSNFSDGLALLPDLADEPIDAPWLRRGSKASRNASETVPDAHPTAQTPVVQTPVVQTPGPAPARPKRSRRRRFLAAVGVLVVLVLLVGAGTLFYAQRQFDAIERVEVASLLTPTGASGTNYLIVGSDSRENLDPDVENAAAIFGDGTQEIGGQRTDTIQILRVLDDGTLHMLALPRDLYVPLSGDRGSNRINAAYAFGGPELLISTVQSSLGIPVHHYAEIDFGGFIELVDAVGGVTIEFPYPAFDNKTGLDVPVAGPARLDSTQALAFVRSRFYTEVIDGRAVIDPRGDLGRVKRQQIFLQSLFGKLSDPTSVMSALSDLDTSTGSVKLDDRLSFGDALTLANRLRGLDLNSDWDLVVNHATTSSGAQVLRIDDPASQATLDFFSR